MLVKDVVVKTTVMNVGTAALGAKLTIGHFSWGILTQKVVIKNLCIEHPPGFPAGGGSAFGGEAGEFIDMPQVVLRYDIWRLLFKGQYHLPLVEVNLKQMTVIKNDQGKLNVDALKIAHPDEKTKTELPLFAVDVLKLNVGQVLYKDYYKKESPDLLVYDLNLKNRTFKNIKTIPQLMTIVIVQALKPTAIQSAGMYAAATIMGIGFLPGAVLGVIVAEDEAKAEFNESFNRVYGVCLAFIKEKGTLKMVDKAKGTITGKIAGVDVAIKVTKLSFRKTGLVVSARKYMMAKREYAAGILYQLSERLK